MPAAAQVSVPSAQARPADEAPSDPDQARFYGIIAKCLRKESSTSSELLWARGYVDAWEKKYDNDLNYAAFERSRAPKDLAIVKTYADLCNRPLSDQSAKVVAAKKTCSDYLSHYGIDLADRSKIDENAATFTKNAVAIYKHNTRFWISYWRGLLDNAQTVE